MKSRGWLAIAALWLVVGLSFSFAVTTPVRTKPHHAKPQRSVVPVTPITSEVSSVPIPVIKPVTTPRINSTDELDSVFTIGTGPGTRTSRSPFFKNALSNLTSTIYSSALIGHSGTIYSLGLYAGTAGTWAGSGTDTIEIWMKETTASTFTTPAPSWSTNDSGAILVYRYVSPTAGFAVAAGWNMYVFQTPFVHNNANNLMVLFRSTVTTIAAGNHTWAVMSAAGNVSDTLAGATTAAGHLLAFYPSLRLDITTFHVAGLPVPADSATGIPTNVGFTWNGGGATYDVLLDTISPPVTQVATGDTVASYQPASLLPNHTYYWQIVSHLDSMSATGPIWSFTTAAGAAPNAPTDGAFDTSTVNQIAGSFLDNATDETGFPVFRSTDGTTFTADMTLAADPGTGGVVSFADTGLAVNTRYWYRIFATNSETGMTSINFASFNGWTEAITPDAPSDSALGISTISLLMSYPAGNPVTTQYAIYDSVSNRYLQAGRTFNTNPVWQTATTWGNTIAVTGLATSTLYAVKVKARNGGNVDTPLSPPLYFTLSALTLPYTQDWSGFTTGTTRPVGWTASRTAGTGTGNSIWRDTTSAAGSPCWAYVDYFGIADEGEIDRLITPPFNTMGVNAAEVDFSYGYQGDYNTDSLNFAYTLDNGVTWVDLWSLGGTDLDAGDGGDEDAPSSFANAGNIQIALPTAVLNQTSVKFAFIGVNEFGQDIFVSNFQIMSLSACVAEGRVVTHENAGIPGVTVSIRNGAYTTTTDEFGNWQLLFAAGIFNRTVTKECWSPVISVTDTFQSAPDTNRFVDTLYMPTAAASPTSLEFVVDSAGTASQTVVLTNSGDWPLDYHALVVYPTDSWGKRSGGNNSRTVSASLSNVTDRAGKTVTAPKVAIKSKSAEQIVTEKMVNGKLKIIRKNVSSARTMAIDELDTTGGPDSFGYRFVDSNSPGGPTFSWVDISSTGTSVFPTGEYDDDVIVGIPLGTFSFNYYGVNYSGTTIGVCSNGFIQMSSTNLQEPFDNLSLPAELNSTAAYDGPAIFPAWDDWIIDGSSGGWAKYQNMGDGRFIIQWHGYQIDGSALDDMEAILFSSGDIVFQYNSGFSSSDFTATIGIQNASTGGNFLEWGDASAEPVGGLAILFHPGSFYHYVSVSPDQGQVVPGQPLEFSVTVTAPDSTPLNTDLSATLHITTNACTTLTVPITIHVLHQDSSYVSERGLPVEYKLYQNYPNPFNPTTEIRFDLKKAGMTRMTVYNSLGQQVARLVNNYLPAGYHSVRFRSDNLATGVYFYRIESGSFVALKKMVMVK